LETSIIEKLSPPCSENNKLNSSSNTTSQQMTKNIDFHQTKVNRTKSLINIINFKHKYGSLLEHCEKNERSKSCKISKNKFSSSLSQNSELIIIKPIVKLIKLFNVIPLIQHLKNVPSIPIVQTDLYKFKQQFNGKYIDYMNKYNIDDKVDYTGKLDDKIDLEFQIKKMIQFEGKVFLLNKYESEQVISHDHFNNKYKLMEKYIIIIGDILYLYDKIDKFENYKKAYFLTLFQLREITKRTINSSSYFSFILYFNNDQQKTFFINSENECAEIVTKIRKSIFYRDYFKKYNIISKEGSGSSGTVHLSYEIDKTRQLATKIMHKSLKKSQAWQNFKREIDILKVLDHPNLIKFVDIFENSEFYFLVTEFLGYGTLTKAIKNKIISECDAANIIFQLVSAVKYLHKMGIVHRDIKPDNILLANNKNEEILKIKLIDFGLGVILGKDELIDGCCGTLPFCAPEILLKKRYNFSVDIWSIGITTFLLLTKKFPFKVTDYSDKRSSLKQKVYKGICYEEFNLSIDLKDRSVELQDFVHKCLEKDVNKRMNIDELLMHPWLSEYSVKFDC